jgi:ribulose bisphosphate carboxylase small subunit
MARRKGKRSLNEAVNIGNGFTFVAGVVSDDIATTSITTQQSTEIAQATYPFIAKMTKHLMTMPHDTFSTNSAQQLKTLLEQLYDIAGGFGDVQQNREYRAEAFANARHETVVIHNADALVNADWKGETR